MSSPEPTLEDVLPLTPLQEGLLFHADSDQEDVYTVRTTVTLTGPLDTDRLRQALDTLLARHPNLRVGFWYEDLDRPVQFVAKDATAPFRVVDLEGTSTQDGREEIARIEADESREPFDLTSAPPLRCTLIRHTKSEHTLVLTNHHIILDGWSMPILVRELMEIYAAGQAGAPLPAAPAFRDHLAWLASRDIGAAEHAWAEALAEAPKSTEVLGSSPAPSPGGGDASPHRVELSLSPEEEEDLTTAPSRIGVTVNTLVQTAWALVVSRHTGRHDVVFGATVSGRSTGVAGTESMIGLLINTIPVRVRPRAEESGAELARRIQDEQGALSGHQHLGLGRIQRAAGPGAEFDSLLVMENYPLDPTLQERSFAGVGVDHIDVHDATHYPLTLVALPGGKARFVLGHRTDVCDKDKARSLLEEFVRILLDLARRPERRPAELAPATESEVALLSEVNGTEVVVGPGLLGQVPEGFGGWSGRPALVDADSGVVVDHAGFRGRVNRLARVLVDRGVGPGDVVAVGVPRSVDLVVALHAVVVAGGAYVPLDLGYPAERLRWVLEDCRPRVVITTEEGSRAVPEGIGEHLVLDDPDTVELIAGHSGANVTDADRRAVLSPDDLAYVIYTSGSTGRPKGVGVSHRAVVNRLEWMQHRFALSGEDRVVQKTPSSFDVSVWEFFWPLRVGSSVVVVSPQGHRDPAYLARIIREYGVTVCHFVPSMLRAFLAEPLAARCVGLRWVFASGEALTSEVAEEFFALLPGVALVNLYGPTEAAVDVTWFDASEGVGRGGVPIGRPVWNTRVYVLDGFLRPVPEGVVGDLYLSGVQLARGYQGRPGLTAERFVADPFSLGGGRMYRTGDLVRFRGGVLEFVGRSDFQVKVRGQRIELGEIEAVLGAVSGVSGAVVTVAENTVGEQVLVGHVSGSADLEWVRGQVARALPEYMVPVVMVDVAEWPLSPNGKLDRSALPAPDFQAHTGQGEQPHNEREQAICDAFTTVLALDRVRVDDDFFRLGGDSISALRLITKISGNGFEVTVHDVFSHPTPAGLARIAREPAPTEPAEHSAPSTPLISLGTDQMARLEELGQEPR